MRLVQWPSKTATALTRMAARLIFLIRLRHTENMRIDLQNDSEKGPGAKLVNAWTFFLGCVFLIAGLAHSIVPLALDLAAPLGHGFDALAGAIRTLASHVRSDFSIVAFSAMITLVHAMNDWAASLIRRFRRR